VPKIPWAVYMRTWYEKETTVTKFCMVNWWSNEKLLQGRQRHLLWKELLLLWQECWHTVC